MAYHQILERLAMKHGRYDLDPGDRSRRKSSAMSSRLGIERRGIRHIDHRSLRTGLLRGFVEPRNKGAISHQVLE